MPREGLYAIIIRLLWIFLRCGRAGPAPALCSEADMRVLGIDPGYAIVGWETVRRAAGGIPPPSLTGWGKAEKPALGLLLPLAFNKERQGPSGCPGRAFML